MPKTTKKPSQTNSGVRRSLKIALLTAVAAIPFLMSMTAKADTATETVVVTGSRIPQQNVDISPPGRVTGIAIDPNDPNPGIDIIVNDIGPGGTVVAIGHVSKKSGKFSVQVKKRGHYTISTACKQSACPSYRVLIKASGVPLKHGTGGNFTVGNNAPVVLSGQIQSYGATINWGDGTSTTVGQRQQSASHKNTNDGRVTIDWGDGTPPGIMGDPIPGIDVDLGKGGAGRKASAPTGQNTEQGNQHDVDIPVPDIMVNIPDVGGSAGGP